MSLSRPAGSSPRGTGRVILGVQSQGLSEMSVSELEAQRGGSAGWKDKDYDEYHRRVRERAEATAKDILSAAVAEARALREQASREGFRSGLAQCQSQAAAAVEQNADILGQAMLAVQNVGRELWADYRADVTALVRLVVEKILRLELSARRAEVLASLMDQALDAIDSQRGLTVRVNPEDQELAAGLLERAKAKHPGLERWGIRPDAGLDPGGIIVESDRGVVDNSIDGRWKLVEPILDHLSDQEVSDEEVQAAVLRAASRPTPVPRFAPAPASAPAPEPEPFASPEPAVPFETAGDSESGPTAAPEEASQTRPEPAPEAAPEPASAPETPARQHSAATDVAEPEPAPSMPSQDDIDAMLAQATDTAEPEATPAPASQDDIDALFDAAEAAPEISTEPAPEVAPEAAPSMPSQDDIDAMLAQATDAPAPAPEPAPAKASQDDIDALFDAAAPEPEPAAAPSQDDIDAMLAQATDAPAPAPEPAPAKASQDDIDALFAAAAAEPAPAPKAAAPTQDDIDAMLAAATGDDSTDGDHS